MLNFQKLVNPNKTQNSAEEEKKLREMKIWAKLDSSYFVQFRSYWVEKCDQGTFTQF